MKSSDKWDVLVNSFHMLPAVGAHWTTLEAGLKYRCTFDLQKYEINQISTLHPYLVCKYFQEDVYV